jgi:hypothetical protein
VTERRLQDATESDWSTPVAQAYFAQTMIKSSQNMSTAEIGSSFDVVESTCFFDKTFVQHLRGLEDPEKYALIRKFWSLSNSNSYRFDGFASTAFLEHVTDKLERVRHHRSLFAVQGFDGTFAIIQKIGASLARPYRDSERDIFSIAERNVRGHSTLR